MNGGRLTAIVTALAVVTLVGEPAPRAALGNGNASIAGQEGAATAACLLDDRDDRCTRRRPPICLVRSARCLPRKALICLLHECGAAACSQGTPQQRLRCGLHRKGTPGPSTGLPGHMQETTSRSTKPES